MKRKNWKKRQQEFIEEEREKEMNEDVEYYQILTAQGVPTQKAWELIANNIYEGSI